MAQFRTIEKREMARKRNCVLYFSKQFIAMLAVGLSVCLTACFELDGRDSVGAVESKDEKKDTDTKNAVNVDSLANAIRQEVTNSLKDSLDAKSSDSKSEINWDSIAEARVAEAKNSLNEKNNKDSSKADQSAIRTLFAEDLEFAKKDVYGAFANQYSLMYEDFSYLNEDGDVVMIPMPFPMIVANLCDSSIVDLCTYKKIMVKSWISGFSDTSTITDVIDPDSIIYLSPMFTFDENALFALTSPKKNATSYRGLCS